MLVLSQCEACMLACAVIAFLRFLTLAKNIESMIQADIMVKWILETSLTVRAHPLRIKSDPNLRFHLLLSSTQIEERYK